MDKKDKQILEIVSKNSRLSYSAIAKLINLSKNSVINRIARLQEAGYYTKDLMIVDSRIFGYTIYQIFIQLDPEVEDKDSLLEKVKSFDRAIWSNTFVGSYTLQVIVDAKTPQKFLAILSDLFELCDNKIKKYTVLTHTYDLHETRVNPEIMFNINLPKNNDASFSNLFDNKSILKEKKFTSYDLSRVEIEVLHELTKNPRIQLNDLAEKLGIDRKTLKNKIAGLIKNRVITSFTSLLDAAKFGYTTYMLMVKLKPNTTDEGLIRSFKKLNNIFYAARFFGEHDMLLYIYSKNPQELENTVHEFEKKLGSHITDTQLLIVDKVLNWKQFTDGLYRELKREI